MKLRVGKTYKTKACRVLSVTGKDGDRWIVQYLDDNTTVTAAESDLAVVAEVPSMRFVPKFIAADGTVIEFFAIADTPGFTHRVAINGVARDWLGKGQPSVKTAEFFRRKHSTGAAAGGTPLPRARAFPS